MKMMANCLFKMAEKLDKVAEAILVPEIPTDTPDPPQMTQWVGG